MKRAATKSNQPDSHKWQSRAPTFAKVIDGRKQPIRGLWVRNGRFYARLSVEDPLTGAKATRRVPLMDKQGAPVQTIPQAVAELKRLQTQRADGTLPVLERTPKFADFVGRYLDFVSSGQGAKKLSTVGKERAILHRWTHAIGTLRLDQIKRVHVNRFIEARLKHGTAARTINLDVITFRVVMKRALEEGVINRLPTEGLLPLKATMQKRALVTAEELDRLCEAAFLTKTNTQGETIPLTENAQKLVDYIRLLAYSGCRRNEALGLNWDDVDFDNGQLHVRRQITVRGIESLKNREERTADLNAKLRAHLLEMASRLAPDSSWLFPSPQRGERDVPAKSFMESLKMVRQRAGLPAFNFHDCRHHFISMCVMSGIDYMTIAAWVGHRDGGVLIGKVYGHLANEHRKAMAEKVNFGPTVLAAAVA